MDGLTGPGEVLIGADLAAWAWAALRADAESARRNGTDLRPAQWELLQRVRAAALEVALTAGERRPRPDVRAVLLFADMGPGSEVAPLTTRQVADRLGCTARHVRRLGLRAVARNRWAQADVEALEQHRRTA